MSVSAKNLNEFKAKLEASTSFTSAQTPAHAYEHLIAKAYLLGLFERFPRYDVKDLTEVSDDMLDTGAMVSDDLLFLQLHINHFLWARADKYKEGVSPVNDAIKLLANNKQLPVYLNRKQRFDTEKSLIQKILEQIFVEVGASIKSNHTLLMDLDLTKVVNFYEMTEDPQNSVIQLNAHTASHNDWTLFDKTGFNLMHHACVAGDADLLNQLTALGVNVNAKTRSKMRQMLVSIGVAEPDPAEGDTPLALAVKHNKVDAVKALLEADNIDADHAHDGRYNALSLAISMLHKEIAVILFAHPAVFVQRYDLKQMLALGLTEALDIYFQKTNTPLMRAVIRNDLNEVKKLIALPETDINAKRYRVNNETALDISLNEDITLALLSSESIQYNSILLCQRAVNNSWVNVVTFLIDNQKLDNLSPHLLKASSLGNEELSILFIRYGADVNVSDAFDKNTPLHYAVKHRMEPVVALLLNKGAYIYAVSSTGESSVSVAIENNFAVLKFISHHTFDATKPIYIRNENKYKLIAQIADERNLPSVKEVLGIIRQNTLEIENAILKNKLDQMSGKVEKTYLLAYPQHGITQQDVAQTNQTEHAPVAQFFTHH